MALDFTFLCKDPADFYGSPLPGCFGNADEGTATYLQHLITAFGNTAFLAITAMILAIAVGFTVGTLRTLPNQRILPFLTTCWIEFFRNIPLLVMVFLCYFVIPKLFPAMNDLLRHNPLSGLYLVIGALGFFTSARIAEQVRSGIGAISTGQRYAAQALGFTTFQTYRYVLLPRTLRIIMPPLTSEVMGIVKNSAVAIGVSVAEMMNFLNETVEETARSYEIYIIVTVLYILLALTIFAVTSFIQRMLYIPGNETSKGT